MTLLNSLISLILIFNFIIPFYSFPNFELNKHWKSYKLEHGKSYRNSIEESMRREIFRINKEKIDKFNLEKSEKYGYKQGLNHLSDITNEEYEQLKGLKLPKNIFSNSEENLKHQLKLENFFFEKFSIDINSFNDDNLPKSVDWTKVPGRVSEIKDQKQCGSSWAFAATGVLEGQMISQGMKNLISLSEQNLIDCSTKNKKCSGGWMGYALDDVKELGGIQDELSYPYTASNTSECLFNRKKSVFYDEGNIMLPRKDERKLKLVVAKFGPVAASIYSSLDSFRNYKSGVYRDDECLDDKADLGILIVGYGTDEKGGDYWLIKNCWSNKWGDGGYMKVARNQDDMCGIAVASVIPNYL